MIQVERDGLRLPFPSTIAAHVGDRDLHAFFNRVHPGMQMMRLNETLQDGVEETGVAQIRETLKSTKAPLTHALQNQT
jgi:hypothetical protein